MNLKSRLMALGIALYKPQIPPNTGNIARLSVALECELFVAGKTPIKWDESSLRRAGLDHWDKVRFQYFPRFRDLYQAQESRRLIAITKESSNNLWDFVFEPDDILLFGNETRGLPPSLIRFVGLSLKIPMWGEGVRSLNLSNSAAVVAYEYCRQMAIRGKIRAEGNYYRRTYYRQNNIHEQQER